MDKYDDLMASKSLVRLEMWASCMLIRPEGNEALVAVLTYNRISLLEKLINRGRWFPPNWYNKGTVARKGFVKKRCYIHDSGKLLWTSAGIISI